MKFTVTLHLRPNHNRELAHLPTGACILTFLVEAETYNEALEKLNVQADCYKVEITLIDGER